MSYIQCHVRMSHIECHERMPYIECHVRSVNSESRHIGVRGREGNTTGADVSSKEGRWGEVEGLEGSEQGVEKERTR